MLIDEAWFSVLCSTIDTELMVPYGTNVKGGEVAGISTSKRRREGDDELSVRERILGAAFTAFTKKGYAATSTAEIATRARVSKREIYALVGNKEEMLIACISERARRLHVPTDLPVPRDREILARVLTSFGGQLLREISDPTVIAVFRLAIAEAAQRREVAQVLDSIGRETSRAALGKIMAEALESGLLEGHPAECAEQFSGLLWGNLMVSLLLGVAKRPTPQEIAARADNAAAAFLRLHPTPDVAARRAASGHKPRVSRTNRSTGAN
jgi:AcrR family transcriptional regulator